MGIGGREREEGERGEFISNLLSSKKSVEVSILGNWSLERYRKLFNKENFH